MTDHARVHLKQTGEREYVLYHTVPSPMGASHPAVEDHLLMLSDLDIRQIVEDANGLTLPPLPGVSPVVKVAPIPPVPLPVDASVF